MIDLNDLPATRALPVLRRDADKEMLAQAMRKRRTLRMPARRPVLVLGVSAAFVAVGGVAAALTLLPPKAATVFDSGRCYSKISTNFGGGFPGTTVAVAATQGAAAPFVPPQILDACAAVWQAGIFNAGGPAANESQDKTHPTATPHSQVVPQLVACVLPSGQAAVFPGRADTCTSLGLAPLAP